MGKLKNNKEYGWYGSCADQPCNEKFLSTLGSSRDNIDSIIRTRSIGDATGYEKFTCYNDTNNFNGLIGDQQTIDDYFNHSFDTFECGRGYLVNVNTQRSILGEVEIDGLNIPDGKSFVSSDCSGIKAELCSQDGYVELSVSEGEYLLKDGISVEMGTGSQDSGKFSVPPRDVQDGFVPQTILVYMKTSNENRYIAKIIYNGGRTDGNDVIYFEDSSLNCYNGNISFDTDLGRTTCVLNLRD